MLVPVSQHQERGGAGGGEQQRQQLREPPEQVVDQTSAIPHRAAHDAVDGNATVATLMKRKRSEMA